jgi:hypothetical protein
MLEARTSTTNSTVKSVLNTNVRKRRRTASGTKDYEDNSQALMLPGSNMGDREGLHRLNHAPKQNTRRLTTPPKQD